MNYNWLQQEVAPRHLVAAVQLLGTKEIAGVKSNPQIVAWAREVGIAPNLYKSDNIPWCGLFIAVIMHRAGRTPVTNPLWARNWAKFGNLCLTPMLGDVLVFARGSGGHVGIYVGEDKEAFHVLGGNQSDAVTITRISKLRLIACRRPAYNSAPGNIRKIALSSAGTLSTNEA